MKVARSAIVDEEGQRYVEMELEENEFDVDRASSKTESFVRFRIDIDVTGFPRLPEAEEEALRRVKELIDTEIKRLSELRERGGLT